MNATFFNPTNSIYSVKSVGLHDDEKERIMEKVYNSDVFKEFIRQWGNAMPPLDIVTGKENVK
jgi:hypothetical protein